MSVYINDKHLINEQFVTILELNTKIELLEIKVKELEKQTDLLHDALVMYLDAEDMLAKYSCDQGSLKVLKLLDK